MGITSISINRDENHVTMFPKLLKMTIFVNRFSFPIPFILLDWKWN